MIFFILFTIALYFESKSMILILRIVLQIVPKVKNSLIRS